MPRFARLPVALSTVVLLAAFGAAKGDTGTTKPCDTGILVLSGYSDTGSSMDTGSFSCNVGVAKNKADLRILNPGSDMIIIRYEPAVRYSPARLTGTLNGLGWRNKTVYLNKSIADIAGTGEGTPLYETGAIFLPHGASSTGCLKIKLTYVRTINGRKVTVLNKSTQYWTLDNSC